jgi:hypothetical protein
MVDRKSRRQVAELLRHLVAGLITNDEFEERCPRDSNDSAVRQVLDEGAWFLYDDLREHRLTGDRKPSPGTRHNVARWILFLESDLEYEWPVVPLLIRLAFVPINLVTFGFTGRMVQRYASRGGDTDVWPFRRRADYQTALKAPPYLGGAA